MARRYTREEFRERLNKVIESGHPFVIGSAGTGISARFEEEGGADAIGIYNSGRFRMDGLNSTCGQMFFSSANEEILKLAKRVMPVIKDVPVIAGIAGNDPSIEKTTFFEILKFYGFSAVMNFPTCGDFLGFMGDGPEALNEYGIGYFRYPACRKYQHGVREILGWKPAEGDHGKMADGLPEGVRA